MVVARNGFGILRTKDCLDRLLKGEAVRTCAQTKGRSYVIATLPQTLSLFRLPGSDLA